MNTPIEAPRRPVLAACVLALTLALSACGKQDDHAEGDTHAGEEKKEEGEHSEGKVLTLTTEEAERAGIQVEPIRPQRLGDRVVVTATIQPDADRLARVAPRIEGRITAAPAKLGDRVRAGQTLATLDSVEVGEAHAAWVQAQAELTLAETDFQRAKQLADEEIIARKDFLRAQSDRDKAAAALRAAADTLRLLGGSPQAGDVSAFAVTAPFAGTVIAKDATLGELGRPGEALFTLADLSRVWIQADLPEAALAKVRVGAAATVTVPAYPGESFSGRVDLIGAVLDKDTRTVAARIVVPNADGRLKPQMFATATIDSGAEQREALLLPDAAIVLMQGQPTVFVFEQGAYEARLVEPGEQVVTAGAYALKARQQKSQLGHGH